MDDRLAAAIEICKAAGAQALDYFDRLSELNIERKGRHDLVSEADRNVEVQIRKALSKRFPNDGLIGEEHDPVTGTSGFTWIIDPIDGTNNFLSGRPVWCVVLACIRDNQSEIGVIFDPCHNDLYTAVRGKGAELNGKPMRVAEAHSLADGALGIGHSRFSSPGSVGAMVNLITDAGGTITASGSGALSIAYVAAGRTIGHLEGFMKAWDCLAALLMVEEAGGRTESLSPSIVLTEGTRIVTGPPAVFAQLVKIADETILEKQGS